MNSTLELKEQLSARSIRIFLEHYGIKNEQGLPLEFKDRRFLIEIYKDLSPLQVVMKAPQIGLTTLMTIKSLWVAYYLHKDIIYTLPTQSDVQGMAAGSINRIVAQNPIFNEWVKDHDSVESKRVGTQTIHYRGTWTGKQAMMVPSQLNIHDEVDASKSDIIEQYETRLQSTANGWRWYFSHPSLPDYGVDKFWQISDQKHWFITCPTCEEAQYLSWPDSIDKDRRCYQCKSCKAELSDDTRRNGVWVAKYKDRQFSGYWVSQLMCPWITADKILTDFVEKTPDYFYNYVLGLPYSGGDAKITQQHLFQNLTNEQDVPETNERVVLGIDTGKKLDFVLGNTRLGLFHHGDAEGYAVLDGFMRRWSSCIAVIDAGGDFIGAQEFFQRWPGRVFKAYAGEDRKNNELFRWGTEEEQGQVIYDLNRTWQLVADEFREHRIPLQGTENDWWEYWLDWKNMSRIKVVDDKTGMFKGIKWVRNGRNHRASATLFWRIGMSKFSGGSVSFISSENQNPRKGFVL
jgi:hypothetical protein